MRENKPIVAALWLVMGLLVGCWGDGGPVTAVDGFLPVERSVAYAVVGTEFGGATGISLLDSDGCLVTTNWLTSGTVEPGLVTVLSTDITMPSVPEEGFLMVVDRATGVLTRIDPSKAEVTGQLVVDYNPADVVVVGPNSAWVTRRETDRIDESIGGDLVEFDPATMLLTGRRIDLSAAQDASTNPKPLRAALVNGLLVVGLDRLSVDDVTNAADGAIAVVDPNDATLTPTFVSLLPLKNCGDVRKVPNADKVAVTCNGFPFNDDFPYNDRMSSGMVIVEIGADPSDAAVVEQWVVGESDANPLALQLATPLGGNLVLAGEADEDFTSYTYFVVDVATGEVSSPFVGLPQFGKIAFDPDSGLLLVPSDIDGVKRFVYADSEFTELEPLFFGKGALPTFGIWAL